MSTRVQKGSTVFKPIAKGRPRSVVADHTRQISGTPDPQGSTARATFTPVPPLPITSAKSTSASGNAMHNVVPDLSLPSREEADTSLKEVQTSALQSQSSTITVVQPQPSTSLSTPVLPHNAKAPSQFSSTHSPPMRSIPVPPSIVSTPSQPSPAPLSIVPSRSIQQSQSTGSFQSTTDNISRSTPSSLTSTKPSTATTLARSSESRPQLYSIARPFTFPPQPRDNVEIIPSGHPSSSLSSTERGIELNFARIIEEAAMAENAENHPQPPASAPADLQPTPTPLSALRLQLNTESVVQLPRSRRKRPDAASAEEMLDGTDESTTKKVRGGRRKAAEHRPDVADGQADVDPSNTRQTPTRKRRARKVTREDDSDDADSGPEKTKRRRKSTSTPRSQQGHSESVAPFDPHADPGEELDPTVVRMADLCEDTGQGRISSKAVQIFENHAAWKRSNRERRARMKAIMEAKKYGRNEDDADAPAPAPDRKLSVPTAGETPVTGSSRSRSPSHPSQMQDEDDADSDDGLNGFDYSQAVATTKFHVQVRIGPNGETIVDEESLFVDRGEEAETGDYTHVEESDATKFVNSATYGKKYRGSRWSAEETELFYDALAQFGENYELISYVLPGRDRKSCKNKFKSEDKKNPNRITHCLNNRVPYDMQTLSRMTGKDFSGPTPVIRAKTPPNLAQMDVDGSPNAFDRRNRTSGPGDTADETVSPTSVKRSSSGPPPHKNKGKGREDDSVEVLGAADENWD